MSTRPRRSTRSIDSRARVRVVSHEDVDGALHEGGTDAATEGCIDAADDLDVKGAAVSGLAVELGDSSLGILLVLVREADDGVWGGRVEGGGGDGTTPLEDGLRGTGGRGRGFGGWDRGGKGEGKETRTSTSAAVVPLARPATWTTLPREDAPLIERPPLSPRASLRALSAMPKFILGAPAGGVFVRRSERERASWLYKSCCQVSLTSPLGIVRFF